MARSRTSLRQTLMFATTVSSTLMLYTGARILTNTESPIVVVLSGSMEPAFQRGDLLFLTNPPTEQYTTGDIVVYKVPGADIPIVHRVIEARDVETSSSNDIEKELGADFYEARNPRIWKKPAKDQRLLTKGDNNPSNDIVLYNGLERLRRRHIIGKVRGFVPYIGYISIVLNDIPRVIYTTALRIRSSSLLKSLL